MYKMKKRSMKMMTNGHNHIMEVPKEANTAEVARKGVERKVNT